MTFDHCTRKTIKFFSEEHERVRDETDSPERSEDYECQPDPQGHAIIESGKESVDRSSTGSL